MPFDRETEGLIKAGLAEKRAIEEGRLKPTEAYNIPPGLRPRPPGETSQEASTIEAVGVVLGMLGIFAFYLLAGALAGAIIRNILLFEIRGLQLYVPIGLSLACLAIGTAFWFYRDIRRYWQVALAQIIIATAGGVAAMIAAPDYITKGIALAAAVVAVADGIEKLTKALKANRGLG